MRLFYVIFLTLIAVSNGLQEKKVLKQTFRSVHKKYLRGHVFKTTTQAIDPQHCLADCWKENDRCQSFNYFPESDVCELNEASEETHPEDLVDRPGIVYLKNPVYGPKNVGVDSIHRTLY